MSLRDYIKKAATVMKKIFLEKQTSLPKLSMSFFLEIH